MAIYRRGSVWWYSFSVNGKQYRASCHTQDEKQAQEYHDQQRSKAWREKRLGEKPRRLWSEGVERWLKAHEHKRSYRDDQRYAKFWSDEFERRDVVYLDEVDPDVVGDVLDCLRERENRYGESLANGTINRYIALLRAVMNACAREYLWVGVNPKFPTLTESERLRYLTHDEFMRLLPELAQPYQAMALLAVTTGLRRGNVCGLEWTQVNFSRRTITFPGQVMKNGSSFAIPLNDTALAVIKSQIGKHDRLVFPRPDGKQIQDIPSKMWKQALEKAGIQDFRWHDLRHTWASWLRQDGESLDRIQELGGWDDPSMVQRYAHLDVSHLAGSARRLDRLMGSANQGNVQTLHTAAA
jgi:integrase